MSSTFSIVVLIPHFNNSGGLIKSLQSIQNFNNTVCALVVDDGSTKDIIDVEEVKNSCSIPIEFLFLDTNMGIERALNAGLTHILNHYTVSYIARLDCDDLCINNRFQIQYNFLESHKDISFIGSNVCFVDAERKQLFDLSLPTDDKDIKKRMFLNAMFIHPTIFFRTELLSKTGLYPTNKKAAEDYAFFFKVIQHCKVANIPQKLVECVMNPDGISGKQRKQQVISRLKVIKEHFYIGFYPLYGLVRNIFLLLIPQRLSNVLKSYLKV